MAAAERGPGAPPGDRPADPGPWPPEPHHRRLDWSTAETILRKAAERHTVGFKELEEEAIKELRRRYFLGEENPGPRVYWRLTDNWLEMTVRFVVRDHGVRAVKDAMSREILASLKAAGIDVASATYEIVGAPELKVRWEPAAPGSEAAVAPPESP